MYTASFYECRDYDYKKVKLIIEKSIDDIGGIYKFIEKGDRVLIKPNLVMAKTPDKAATTHPNIVCAIAEIIIEAGAIALIAESPSGPFNELGLKHVYGVCGMNEVSAKSGAELNFNTDVSEVAYTHGKILKRITVMDEILKADKVINVCKLKTHGMMRMTGAVKNLYGIIPGTMKAEYHLNRSAVDDFANAIIDICLFANPVLNIMDAIVGMEGDGPTGGTPREVGAVIISDNAFVLDIIGASLINVNVKDIPICKESVKREICPQNVDEIKIFGDNFKNFIVRDFKVPKSKPINVTEKLPPKVYKLINNILQPYPYFYYEKCISCGHCKKSCPPEAIDMIDGRPIVDKNKCIRCFCCQELCPATAVKIKKPLIYKIFSSL